MKNGVEAWSFSSSQYVKSAVSNVEDYLSSIDKKLPRRATSPISPGYRPEVDISPELPPIEARYYQSLIGILRWIVELGRVDITTETSMMASYMVLPRMGHLDQVLHIFEFLKNFHNSEMVFNPSYPEKMRMILSEKLGKTQSMERKKRRYLRISLNHEDMVSS